MASLTSLFRQSQPPTPPKHLDNDRYVDEAIKSLDTTFSSPISHSGADLSSRTVPHLDTPPPSSPIEESAAEQLQKRTKRLRFSSETRICGEQASGAESSTHVFCSAPARMKIQPSAKSILKASDYKPSSAPPSLGSSGSAFPPGHTFESLAIMLQSVVTALSSSDLHTRRDAYHALTTSLRAYKDFPSIENLTSSLTTLEQCIERDISITPPSAKVPEQALQCAFVLIGRLPEAVSARFLSNLIDRSIKILEGCDVPKETAKHQLNLLTLDEMYGRSMTSDRAKRLLKGLTDTDKWLIGQSILGVRLIIYKQIARHQPNCLLEDVQTYLPHVFHGLVSSVKELRLRAMETGLALGNILGERQRFSRAVEILLETKSNDGTPYAAHVRNVLNGMLKRAHDLEHVPQVWGVVTMMLRGNPKLVWKWLQNRDWLMILQSCFNKGDTTLNRFAWTAWNLAIFAAGSLLVDQEDVCKRLVQPVIGHLQRFTTKAEDPVKQAAYSTLNLLWYNAFGQPLEDSKAEACWKHLVHDVCRKVLEKNPQEATRLGRRISQVLSGPGLKVWRSDRAVDSGKAPVSIQELPRIDPQWTRRYCTHILSTTKLFVLSLPRSKPNSEAAKLLWHSLMISMSQATEKEIKVSKESKKAIATIVNALLELSRSSESMHVLQFRGICDFATSAVTCLGPDVLVEESIRMTAEGQFESLTSPVKHGQASAGMVEAAFVSIFRILASCDMSNITGGEVSIALSAVLCPLLQLRGGIWSTITTLRNCWAALGPHLAHVIQAQSSMGFMWQAIVELAQVTLEASDIVSRKKGTDSLGREYLNVVAIIGAGLHLRNSRCTRLLYELYRRVSRCARDDAGDGGYLLAVAAPCTKLCVDSNEASTVALIGFLSAMSEEGIPTPDEKALAQVAKVLGERFISSTTDGPLEWFMNICQLACRSLTRSYNEIENLDGVVIDESLAAVLRLSDDITRLGNRLGPVSALFILEIQDGLTSWAQEKEEKIQTHSEPGLDCMNKVEICPSSTGIEIFPVTDYSLQVERLWRRQLQIMSRQRVYEKQLAKFEDCFVKGFCSYHKNIANSTIEAWNALMDSDASVRPSPRFLAILEQLQTHTEIQVPTVMQKQAQSRRTTASSDLPVNDEDIFPWLRPNESQTSRKDAIFESALLSSAYAHSRPLIARTLPSQPKTAPKKVTKISSHHKTPPPRLRHNDSQVQFVAVALSPLPPEDQESQMMTDRQKETRERQKRETMLFTDLRSSSPVNMTDARLNVLATKGNRPQAVLDGTDEAHLQQLPEMQRDVLSPERPRKSVTAGEANTKVLNPDAFVKDPITASTGDHGTDVDQMLSEGEHLMKSSIQQADDSVGERSERHENLGDAQRSHDSRPEDTDHDIEQRGPQEMPHTAKEVDAEDVGITIENNVQGQDHVPGTDVVEEIQPAPSNASRTFKERVSEAEGMDITDDMEPVADVFHDATSEHEDDDGRQTLVGSSQPQLTIVSTETGVLQQETSPAERPLAMPTAETRTSIVKDSFINHEPVKLDGQAPGTSEAQLGERERTADHNVESASDALPQSSIAEASVEAPGPEKQDSPASDDGTIAPATGDAVAQQASPTIENESVVIEDNFTTMRPDVVKEESKAPSRKAMRDVLNNEHKDTASDDSDCIIVREATDATPPLRDLLKARGALSDRTNSPFPSLLTTKRRGRSSLKRRLESMEDAEANSQASQQDTPTNSRSPRAKRRKSAEKTSQASLSQQSAAEIALTIQSKRRRSRRSDVQSQDQQEALSQEQNDNIEETSQAIKEVHDTSPPSQARRSTRLGNASETVELFEPVELPPVQKRRKTVTVVVDQPAQPEDADEDTQLTPKSNKVDNDDDVNSASTEPALKGAADPAQSLILRLQAVLEEAEGLRLSQENEEIASDLAFQLQREIAKAGRRSRV